MERIYGIPVTDTEQLTAQNTNMKALAEHGVEIFFTQVFTHNFFHADMHPGNIFVSREHPQRPQYIAVDMAIVGSLTQEDQYYMARNLLAIFRRDYRLVAELHVQSGWVSSDTPINEFEASIRSVCEPIFEKPLKDISFGLVVINLFQTAQRFNMEVQPQLVLLQKTLLNIEGLGRQLYPDLDLWQTAHPFLEKWMKDRLHPRSVVEQLKRHGPEWLEQLPMVPSLVFSALENTRTLAEAAPELQRAAKQFQQPRPSHRRRSALALTAAAGAAVTALPVFGISLSQLPINSLLLAGVAAWLVISG
jgi:ubiquinone biosynthesis protein